jgi:hypothetical protein
MKWLGVLAVASLCTACGGGSTNDAATIDPALEATDPAAPGPSAPGSSAPGTAAPARAAEGRTGAAPAPKPEPAAPVFREVTLPAGTTLRLELQSAVASDSSNVEDAVRASLRQAVMVDGREVIPAGASLAGVVTDVERSGRVKGRARVAYRFNSIEAGGERHDIATAPLVHEAEATKSEDATKIAIGAGAGAAIGAILGGGDGAAKGAAIGGGAGTGAVLATRGKEVRLGPGADVTTRLTEPLTLRIRL